MPVLPQRRASVVRAQLLLQFLEAWPQLGVLRLLLPESFAFLRGSRSCNSAIRSGALPLLAPGTPLLASAVSLGPAGAKPRRRGTPSSCRF